MYYAVCLHSLALCVAVYHCLEYFNSLVVVSLEKFILCSAVLCVDLYMNVCMTAVELHAGIYTVICMLIQCHNKFSF